MVAEPLFVADYGLKLAADEKQVSYTEAQLWYDHKCVDYCFPLDAESFFWKVGVRDDYFIQFDFGLDL
jgi:hypothetical protein